MPLTHLLRRQVPALLLTVAVLGACGGQEPEDSASSASPASSESESSDASSSPTAGESPSATASASPSPEVPADAPACEQVWQDGERLPRGYRGCVDAGTYVPSDVIGCSSGQRLVRHADRWYAVLGGTVHEASSPLDKDREYVADVRVCRG